MTVKLHALDGGRAATVYSELAEFPISRSGQDVCLAVSPS